MAVGHFGAPYYRWHVHALNCWEARGYRLNLLLQHHIVSIYTWLSVDTLNNALCSVQYPKSAVGEPVQKLYAGPFVSRSGPGR